MQFNFTVKQLQNLKHEHLYESDKKKKITRKKPDWRSISDDSSYNMLLEIKKAIGVIEL